MDSRGVATPLGRPVPPEPTMEKLVYRDFPFFPVSPVALAWEKSFADNADPSGRAIKGVHNSSY